MTLSRGMWMVAALCVAQTLAADDKQPLLGGYQNGQVDKETTDILTNALQRNELAAADEKKTDVHLCFNKINSVEQQVVSGMNYKFHVSGCEVPKDQVKVDTSKKQATGVGACSSEQTKSLKEEKYVVQVYEQAWTDTLLINSIDKENSTNSDNVAGDSDSETAPKQAKSTDAPATTTASSTPAATQTSTQKKDNERHAKSKPDEKQEEKAIDAWIKRNHLNEFGDDEGTAYLGGTPLYDETTGKSIDRYTYIRQAHPDKPWFHDSSKHHKKQSEAFLASENALTQSMNAQAHMKGNEAWQTGMDLAKLCTMLGAFVILVVMIGVLRVRQQTRRFSYSTIGSRDV